MLEGATYSISERWRKIFYEQENGGKLFFEREFAKK
jgi:hypothetical protein